MFPDRMRLWRPAPATPVTTLLVLVNLLVFIASCAASGFTIPIDVETLVDFGANDRQTVQQPWRLICSAFLHVDAVALLTNMWWLTWLGQHVERRWGSWLFLTAYLLSAAGAGLVSAAWNPLAISVGASGAVWGVWGMIAASFLSTRQAAHQVELQRLFAVVMIAIVVELSTASARPHIDTAAHLGGLVAGCNVGWLYVLGVALRNRTCGVLARPAWAVSTQRG